MIHLAGPYRADGTQRCSRCNFMLTDNRNAMVPVGQGPPGAWQEGAYVEVISGNPRYLGVTEDKPTCKAINYDS